MDTLLSRRKILVQRRRSSNAYSRIGRERGFVRQP